AAGDGARLSLWVYRLDLAGARRAAGLPGDRAVMVTRAAEALVATDQALGERLGLRNRFRVHHVEAAERAARVDERAVGVLLAGAVLGQEALPALLDAILVDARAQEQREEQGEVGHRALRERNPQPRSGAISAR